MQKEPISNYRMRINNVMFCFAHLQSCHNGWASNMLIMVDTYPSIIPIHPLCPSIMTRLKMGKTKHPIVYSLNQVKNIMLSVLHQYCYYFNKQICQLASQIDFYILYFDSIEGIDLRYVTAIQNQFSNIQILSIQELHSHSNNVSDWFKHGCLIRSSQGLM